MEEHPRGLRAVSFPSKASRHARKAKNKDQILLHGNPKSMIQGPGVFSSGPLQDQLAHTHTHTTTPRQNNALTGQATSSCRLKSRVNCARLGRVSINGSNLVALGTVGLGEYCCMQRKEGRKEGNLPLTHYHQ